MARAIDEGFYPFGAKIECSWCGARYYDVGDAEARCPECEQVASATEMGIDVKGHATWQVHEEAWGAAVETAGGASEPDEASYEVVDPTTLREDLKLDEVFGDDHWHRAR